MELVYIILINYNSANDTIECVESLKNINYDNYRVIVVDNCSTDNSLIKLKEKLNQCIIIESKKNLGFSGGNNIGIRYALEHNADYVLLLNNDTIVEPDFLRNMKEAFNEDNDIGLVGCKIMYYANKDVIWYGGGYIDWFRFVGMNYQIGKKDVGQCDVNKEINFMTGCCMLIKRDVFKNVGYLAEEYFMYYEDVDFCVRLKEAGYKLWYNPKAIIYHKVGLSSGGEESAFFVKWCTRNRLLFMNKYRHKVNGVSLICSKVFFYGTRLIKYFQYILKVKDNNAKAILDGIRDALGNLRE